jgi:hypothetical protein
MTNAHLEELSNDPKSAPNETVDNTSDIPTNDQSPQLFQNVQVLSQTNDESVTKMTSSSDASKVSIEDAPLDDPSRITP